MKLSKNNKTGYRGVCFETRASKYRAYITIAGEKIRLGYYSNLEEAHKARLEAEEFYSFKNDNGLRPVNFVISKRFKSWDEELYLTGKNALIGAVCSYDWHTESFMTYACRRINEEFDVPLNNKQNMADNFMYFNDIIIKDWLNGNSIRSIAIKQKLSVVYVSAYIKGCIKKFKKSLKIT